ncbi:MAG TPA: tetratricopeptide repeat protein [Candidatus Ratteibacteria bacterium]|nr:tetratricopeptide repeat protein [Candidatus Ratteibacteria bacterium]
MTHKHIKNLQFIIISLFCFFALQFTGCAHFYGANTSVDEATSSEDRILQATKCYERGLGSDDSRERIKFFSRAIEINPQFGDAYFMRADTLTREKRYFQALKDYNKAIAIDPQNSEYLVGRAVVFFLRKQTQKAIADLKKAIEIDPENVHAYCTLASIFALIGKYEDAMKFFNTAIELDPQNPVVYVNRSFLFYKIGEYQKALDDCNKALDSFFEVPNAYSNRGIIYSVFGQYTLAMDDIRTALELDPDNIEIYYDRALIYYHLGLYRKAIEDFEKYLKAEPDGIYSKDSKKLLVTCKKNLDTVVVFFWNTKEDPELRSRRIYPVKRRISGIKNPLLQSLEELIKGPTKEEIENGYYSFFDADVKIKSVRLSNNILYIDFYKHPLFDVDLEELRKGYGFHNYIMVLFPIKETLFQFPYIKDVVISNEGKIFYPED